MLNTALEFLVKKLNTEISVPGQPDSVSLVSIVNEKGEWNVQPGDLSLMLVNVEEERMLRAQLPREQRVNDTQVQLANPEIKLNLLIILAANPGKDKYKEALAILSRAMAYFQGTAVFDHIRHPELAPVEKLTVELFTLTLEQQNQLWASLGAKYIPSAVYKVRLVVIDKSLFGPVVPLIRTIDNRLERIN